MTESLPRRPAHLHPNRERAATPRRATVVIATLVAAITAACGGGARGDTYAKATQVQEQCCEHLQGRGRDQCLAGVTRVDDPGAAKTGTNQQTFACVVEHFVCDPQTGHATQPSAQEQYDCIADLR